MNHLGKKIKKARESKGLTQSALAKQVSLSTRMIQRFEEGEFPKYKSETINRIDRLLGTDLLNQIYDGEATVRKITNSDKQDLNPDTEKRLAKLEATNIVILESLGEILSFQKKKSTALINAELHKAISMHEQILTSNKKQ